MSLSTDELSGPTLNKFLGKNSNSSSYDVKKAKSLLDAEGWKSVNNVRQKGNDKLKLNVVVLKNSNYEKVTRYLAQVWYDELNIESDIKVVDPNDATQNILQTVLQPRNFDVLVYELSLGGDPDVYAYWHSSQATNNGLNFSNYNNAIADDALESGRSKISAKQRADRYAKLLLFGKQTPRQLPCISRSLTIFIFGTLKLSMQAPKLSIPSIVMLMFNIGATEKKSVYKTP